MQELLPTLRSDLIIIPLDLPDGEQEYRIKDPLRNLYITVNVFQYFFFTKLDGHHSIAQVCAEAAEFFETEVPTHLGEKYLDQARKYYLLDIAFSDAPDRALARACQYTIGWLRHDGLWDAIVAVDRRRAHLATTEDFLLGNLHSHLLAGRFHETVVAADAILSLDPANHIAQRIRQHLHDGLFKNVDAVNKTWMEILIPLFSPHIFLDPLNRHIGWLFAPRAMGITTIILASLAVLLQFVMPDISNSFSLGFPLLMLTYLSTSLLHESGHALTLIHLGGRVKALGILIWYGFVFGAYTDISDMHIIPDGQGGHRQPTTPERLAVFFGGLYINCWLAVILPIISLLTSNPTVADYCGYLAKFQIGVIAFNLVPLIRADGYLICQTLLGFTAGDLAETSYGYVKMLFLSFFRRPFSPEAFGPAWRRHILLGYAILRFGYSTFVLPLLLVRLYLWLTARFGAFGFLVCALLLGSVYGKSCVLFVRKLPAIARHPMVTLHERWRSISFATAVTLVLLFVHPPAWIYGNAVLRSQVHAEVRTLVAGQVIEVRVKDAAVVHAGQELARLDDADLRRCLQEVVAQQSIATSMLEKVRKGSRPEEILLASAAVARGRAENVFLTSADERARKLSSIGLSTATDAANRDFSLADGEARLAEDLAALRLAEVQGRPEDVRALEARIAQLDAERANVEQKLARTILRSPIDGVVATAHVEEIIGKRLEPGDILCTIVDPHKMYAEVRIPLAEDLGAVATDDPVKLWFQSGETTRTTLATAPLRVLDSEGLPSVVARTAPLEGFFQEGRTSSICIYGTRRSLAARLLRPARQFLSVDFWSMW